jgi:hypothetical protein
MGKKSSPKTPDVKGAAETEGQYSREAARDATYADRPDQYNAMGSLTWQRENVIDPSTGEATTKWTQRENMSPDMQRIYNSQMSTYDRNAGLAAGMGNRIQQEMGAPVNWAQFGDVEAAPNTRGLVGNEMAYGSPERQRAEDAYMKRETDRLDPRFQKEREALEIQLRNRGLSAGDQQYQSEMQSFNTGKDDAYERARLGAVEGGRIEDQQFFDQQLGANQNARAADQQWFGQAMDSNAVSNQLRQQQIDEYIAKRQFSLGEQAALDNSASSGVAGLANTVGGG